MVTQTPLLLIQLPLWVLLRLGLKLSDFDKLKVLYWLILKHLHLNFTSATFNTQVIEFKGSCWVYDICSCFLRQFQFGVVAPVLLLVLTFHPGETDLNSFISAAPVSCLLWSRGSIWPALAHLSWAQFTQHTVSPRLPKPPVTPGDTRKAAAGEVHFVS